MKTFFRWYYQTAALVGIPITFLLLMLGAQKFLFTLTCTTAGYRCEYAIGATSAMAEYMADLVADNPGMDIVAKPSKRVSRP
jgi:ribose/xylose/arabinose/galactoside ABC-type transport system permease subunit